MSAMSLDEQTERLELINAAHLARELAVFAAPSLAKLRLPPDVRRMPALHYRYLGVAALLRAFGLGEVRDALAGRFIAGRPLESYGPIVERIRKEAGDDSVEVGHWQIEFLFCDLLRFRAEATLDSPFEGAIELEHAYGHFGELLCNSVLHPLAERLRLIDDVLAAILDPEGRTFSKRQMVEQFHHPDVDLRVLA